MGRPQFWLLAHGVAVFFAAFSLIVLIPYPGLWAGLPGSDKAFAFAMEHGGPLHIVLGAVAMLAYGGAVLGWRRTGMYFAVATSVSLSMELLGTGTGWPFGAYGYTAGLGWKVGGRVPFSIPLSWFYLGLTSYLLGIVLVRDRWPAAPAFVPVVAGTWLLMAWDLVLDPAMAHQDLPVKFWVWHERGAYAGMPLVNLAGWVLTGLLFTGLSRALWAGEPDPRAVDGRFVGGLYLMNVLFGVVLCASLGLWLPILLAVPACLVPVAAGWRPPGTDPVVGGVS